MLKLRDEDDRREKIADRGKEPPSRPSSPGACLTFQVWGSEQERSTGAAPFEAKGVHMVGYDAYRDITV